MTWFRESEAPRGRCRERDGSISLWFHGRTSTAVPQHIIDSEHALMLILYSLYCMSGRLGRVPAETLLEKKSVGSYLVRLSVKIWGYTISVKSKEFIGQITC